MRENARMPNPFAASIVMMKPRYASSDTSLALALGFGAGLVSRDSDGF